MYFSVIEYCICLFLMYLNAQGFHYLDEVWLVLINTVFSECMYWLMQKQGKRPGGMLSEEEILDAIEKGHSAMLTVMSGRSRNLQIVRAMWTSGNTKVELFLNFNTDWF